MRQLQVAALLVGSFCFSAVAQIKPPQLGFAVDPVGAFRPLMGVSGALSLGAPLAFHVGSFAYNGQVLFYETNQRLIVADDAGTTLARADLSTGRVLFALAGATGFVLQNSSHSLNYWTGSAFRTVPIDWSAIDGRVVSMAVSDPSHVSLAVRRNFGSIWLLRFDAELGTKLSQVLLSEKAGEIALLNEQDYVETSSTGFMIRRNDGTSTFLPAPLKGAITFNPLGANWLAALDSSGNSYAISITPGQEKLLLVPEGVQ